MRPSLDRKIGEFSEGGRTGGADRRTYHIGILVQSTDHFELLTQSLLQ